MTLLPVSHLRGRGCKFTIVPPAGHKYTLKDGKVKVYTGKDPQGLGWEKEDSGSSYTEDAQKLQKAISRGWNHGLVCGSGGVVVFDGDDADRLQELGVLQKIPATVQVESRPGHRHHHLLCPALQKKFVFYDPIHTEEKTDEKTGKATVQRLHLGEVLGPGGHAVLPGSTHPSGTKYRLVEDAPEEMAEISLDQLKEILRGLEFSPDPEKHVSFEEAAGIETSRKRLEEIEAASRRAKAKKGTYHSPLSDRLDVNAVLAAYSWTPKRTEGDEAKGPAPGHRSESGDCFQVNLRTGRWHCKQCEAGGDLASLVAVLEGITPCTGHDDLRDGAIFSEVLEACERKGLISSKVETVSTEKAKDFLETVKEGLKADPKKLQDPDVLREMATLQKGSPVAFEVLMDEIGIKTDMKTALKKELKLVAALKRTENTADDGHGSALATTVGIVRSALETDPMSRFCYDQVGQPFLYLDAKGRHIPMALDSREFGIWATKTAMALYGIPLARKTIKEADLSIMAVGEEVMARKGLDLRVHMAPRVNVINGSLWYDLGTEDMMGVEVNGQKAAIKPLPLGLVRHPTDLPQVMPDLDASPLEVWKLMDFMPGVQMEDFLFLVAWAVASFLPYWEADGGTRINLPLPLAGFIGPKGSTKTITARFLQKLLDPDAQESQNMPDTPRDMGIVLHNNRAVLFDNITRVHEWQSNALCGGATGGSNTNRKLRTDSEVVVHDYNARTMFTSVIKPEFESDAADRILYFYTRALPPHLKKPEALLFQEFEEVKPRILGAIFNTLQKVMAIYPEVLEESKSWANQVRMADFCVLGECCARIWGFEPGLLRDAYTQTLIGDSGQMVLDDNVVLALRNWVWTSLVLKEGGHWEGLVSELKEALERDLRSIPQDWPAKPNRFSNRLRKAQEDLSRAGISIDFKLSKHGTVVVIDAVGSSPLEAGGDTELITTTIPTRINAIRKAIGGDGGGGGDKYRDNNRKDIDNSTTPLEGRGGSPRGSGQNSDHKGEHTPESITTTTTITTTEAADGDLEGGDGVVISSQEGGDGVVISSQEGGDDHHPDDNLSALLTREKEMDAEDAERKKTPEPKSRDPTADEAEALEEVAGKLLQNWNGIMETRLWEMARDKLGSPLPVAVVRVWLRASGYLKTAEKMNGSPWWNPPAAGEVVG